LRWTAPKSSTTRPFEAIIDFGFQCMGVGAVVAMNGLAQEDIVI
jgi:hypothetical protein